MKKMRSASYKVHNIIEKLGKQRNGFAKLRLRWLKYATATTNEVKLSTIVPKQFQLWCARVVRLVALRTMQPRQSLSLRWISSNFWKLMSKRKACEFKA